MVKGVRGKIYAVTLEPEKCQCPSTGLCYHIMAVKIKLGLPLEKKLNEIKLQAMQDAPPLQLYPASDKFLM